MALAFKLNFEGHLTCGYNDKNATENSWIWRQALLTKLLLLFIIVPALELILLIAIGQFIGVLPTAALITFTGVLGAFLVRRQGIAVLARLRADVQAGRLPADSIFDGGVLLIAGAFLMTPGILTDTAGFLCLIPATRRVIKRTIWTRMQRAMRHGQIFTATSYESTFQDRTYHNKAEDVIIIDHDDYS